MHKLSTHLPVLYRHPDEEGRLRLNPKAKAALAATALLAGGYAVGKMGRKAHPGAKFFGQVSEEALRKQLKTKSLPAALFRWRLRRLVEQRALHEIARGKMASHKNEKSREPSLGRRALEMAALASIGGTAWEGGGMAARALEAKVKKWRGKSSSVYDLVEEHKKAAEDEPDKYAPGTSWGRYYADQPSQAFLTSQYGATTPGQAPPLPRKKRKKKKDDEE